MSKKRYYGYDKKEVPQNIKIEKIEKEFFDCYVGDHKITHKEYRYIILDADTGEIFDDAQGYGYKEYKSALRAFNYKRQSKDKIDAKYNKESAIVKWKGKNKPLVRIIEDFLFYAWKEKETITYSQFEKIYLEECGEFTEKSFTLKDLYNSFVKS